MTPSVVHVFYEVFMGYSHSSLVDMMRENTKKAALERGEVAVFVNKSWTACKILCPGNVLLYYRSSIPMSVETLRYLPTMVGGSKLNFARNLEAHLIKANEAKVGKATKRLKVAYA